MRTVFLIAFMIGMTTAAIQQRSSPVYQPSVTSAGSTTTSVNSSPLKVSSLTTPMTPAPPMPTPPPQQVAQAREGLVADSTMMQPSAANPSTPSQNYFVYYYPHNGVSPKQPDGSSIWNWGGWGDVAVGAGSLAAVIAGGAILYNRYGTEVKSRALRELKDLTAEDAARMARGVLRALEKFSTINNHSE